MFKNYFKAAYRSLARHKIYSFINIAGLSLGLACTMLIMLYVKDEVSFDRFHKNVNNIYRIVSRSAERDQKMVMTGLLPGPRFAQHVPGIKSFVRIRNGREDMKIGNYVISQDLLFADSNFFSVFTFPLLSGDPATCLKDPHSMVLGEDAAKSQFGTTDAVGKIVMIKNDSIFVPYTVTAVSKRCPQNSSIQFSVVLPVKITDAETKNDENWFGFSLNTFVVLNEKANLQAVEKQMQRFYESDARHAFDAIMGKHGGGNRAGMSVYFLQPYLDMHLSTELPVNDNFGHLAKGEDRASNGLTNASKPIYSYILSGIALFVLLIACINFINLNVARSVKRAKEIGIRKVVGGSRKQLTMQFLGESFFVSTIAFAAAIIIVQLLLPLFSDLSNKVLSLSYLPDAKLVSAYIVLYVLTGLLAGFYPALVLSRYDPVQTIYNRYQVAGKNYLQKSLVVLQFTLSSFLIIATLIIYAQFNFLIKTDLGYDDSNLVITEVHDTKRADATAFKNELMKSPDIAGVSAKNWGIMQATTMNVVDSGINFRYETIDENYLPLLKIPLIAGRNFSSSYSSDSALSVIVNESFVKAMHWKDPVGEVVNMDWGTIIRYHVIGVVKDYHFSSLNDKIVPQLFASSFTSTFGTYYIKIRPGAETTALRWMQKVYQQFYPADPFSYVFKNDVNRKEYADVEKWKQILLFGAILTIFISCIGLFGLAVLSAEKRTREIGIRKVFGASVHSLVINLSAGFMQLVIVALVIAFPLAYFAAGKWLQNYPYRVSLSGWLFASAALLVMLIALFTVSFQCIKAAVANPIKSLRVE
jgi:putative ABC transport system permease protein